MVCLRPSLILGASILASTSGHVKLTADDRLHTNALSRREKLDRPVQVTVIGHRYSRLAKQFCLLNNVGEAISSVKETILRMEMKVSELHPYY